jgi:hypothetical protein
VFFVEAIGHNRISGCLRRDVLAWQKALVARGLAPATVNNHPASLSAFTTWEAAQAPAVFPVGDPAKGVRELGIAQGQQRSSSDRRRTKPQATAQQGRLGLATVAERGGGHRRADSLQEGPVPGSRSFADHRSV